jgi:hypothetical protein
MTGILSLKNLKDKRADKKLTIQVRLVKPSSEQ